MEATKKTTVTRAALLVVAALSMLLSGLFIATASRSDASPPPACPDGFNLTADGKNCFQAAVITSSDNPNTCAEGQLTPDGTKCYVPARVIPQEGTTYCPKGYSPDDSLGGMCARFESALQNDPGCPAEARGVAGACYVLVAKGPRGAATCATAGAVLVGTNCVITGADPVNGTSSCPTSDLVLQDGIECYTLVAPDSNAGTCQGAYVAFGSACKAVNPDADDPAAAAGFVCPTNPGGEAVTATVHTVGGITKIAECMYTPAPTQGDCPDGTDLDPNGMDCRQPVALVPGALQCGAGFALVSGDCIRYESPLSAAPQCPNGSVEDSAGECRQPVADVAGSYYCASADAALNGKSCVYTAPFMINPAPTAFKCDVGVRTVIGYGDATQVLCFLGDAQTNTTSGPSCLQGVLSTDNLYCIVPRIDQAPAAAAPTPAFTG